MSYTTHTLHLHHYFADYEVEKIGDKWTVHPCVPTTPTDAQRMLCVECVELIVTHVPSTTFQL
jgi:hypothetical protein